MKKYLPTLAVVVLFLLLAAYRLITFPVLGYHSPACLCDVCLEESEADRPN